MLKLRKSARRDKRGLVDKLAEEAETAAQKNDMKTLHNISRQLSGRRVNQCVEVTAPFSCKISDQLDEWKDYFSSMFNGTPVVSPPRMEKRDDLDINLGPITKAEVVETIKEIKNGKAPGPDNIPYEVMKADTY